ncbi:hypothetical protein JTE90_016518 [Oedothorax gibbosus]|uniref:Uncharacterized protein n=1 Tax=Oedothorax gibbosus TaxID=931172 RepID=A0AAV6TD76_9ARAC|nr:hypothetical protein JTE90_016518 [Oedothorax gibbosus]
MGTKTGTKNYTILPSDFQRPTEAPGQPQESGACLLNSVPYLATSRFQGHRTLSKEKITLPRVRSKKTSTSPSLRLRYALGPRRTISVSPCWGILTHVPFRSGHRDKQRACVCVWANVSASNGFRLRSLRPTDPCSKLLFTWNPSPASVLKSSQL